MTAISLFCVVLLGVAPEAAGPRRAAVADSIRVEVVGTLRAGVVAIGAETTGTTIAAKGITWELDLRRRPELQKLAERLDRRKVLVRGSLARRPGVEIKERWIVNVSDLRPAEPSRR